MLEAEAKLSHDQRTDSQVRALQLQLLDLVTCAAEICDVE